MKKIIYEVLGYATTYNHETESAENVECLVVVKRPYSESNVELAKVESYNGECTIEDDRQIDPKETPSQLDIIEAQVTYTAMMTDTLLEV